MESTFILSSIPTGLSDFRLAALPSCLLRRSWLSLSSSPILLLDNLSDRAVIFHLLSTQYLNIDANVFLFFFIFLLPSLPSCFPLPLTSVESLASLCTSLTHFTYLSAQVPQSPQRTFKSPVCRHCAVVLLLRWNSGHESLRPLWSDAGPVTVTSCIRADHLSVLMRVGIHCHWCLCTWLGSCMSLKQSNLL